VRSSCSHTLSNSDEPANAAWWQLDLGAPFDVSQLVLWPRTDCCTSRNTRWAINLGLSTDAAFDSGVPGVPANVGPDQTTPVSVTFNLPAPVPTRFVTVSRSFLEGDDNILAVRVAVGSGDCGRGDVLRCDVAP
jgi:hypothetical protein